VPSRPPVSMHILNLDALGRTMVISQYLEIQERFINKLECVDSDALMHRRQGGREWKMPVGSR
jgi:hypothetical protein